MYSRDIFGGVSHVNKNGYPNKITDKNTKTEPGGTKEKEKVNIHTRKVRCNYKKTKKLKTTTMESKQMLNNDFEIAATALQNQYKITKVKDKLKIILSKYLENYIEENFSASKKTSILELIRNNTDAIGAFENIQDDDGTYIKDYDIDIRELIEGEAAALIKKLQPLSLEKLKQRNPTNRVKREDIPKETFEDYLNQYLKSYLSVATKFFERELTKYFEPFFNTFSSKKDKNDIFVNHNEPYPTAPKKQSRFNTLKNSTNSKTIYEKILDYGTTYINNSYTQEVKERKGKDVVTLINKIQPISQQLKQTEPNVHDVKMSRHKTLKNNTKSKQIYETIINYTTTYIKNHNKGIKEHITKELVNLINKVQPLILHQLEQKEPDAHLKREDKFKEQGMDNVKISRFKTLKNYVKLDRIYENIINYTTTYIKKHYNQEIKELIGREVDTLIIKILPLISLQFEQTQPNARMKREYKPKEKVMDYVKRHFDKYLNIVADFLDKNVMKYLRPTLDKYPPSMVAKDFHDRFNNKSEPDPIVYKVIHDTFRRLRVAVYGITLNYDELIPKYDIKLEPERAGDPKNISEDRIRPKWDYKTDEIDIKTPQSEKPDPL